MDPAQPPSPGEPALALLAVTHKPITARARQFDGTLESFLDIINARPKAGLAATCRFDEAGNLTQLNLSGGGIAVNLGIGDWAVFPDDPAQPVESLPDAQATAAWQAT